MYYIYLISYLPRNSKMFQNLKSFLQLYIYQYILSVDQIKLSQINQISRFILHLFIFEIWLIGGMFYLFRKGHVHLAKSSQIQVSF